jgi:hypothetical protein
MNDWPAKGTPEYDLVIAAIEVAASAPLEQGANVSYAKVYWPRMHAMRTALETLGIDWRTVKQP